MSNRELYDLLYVVQCLDGYDVGLGTYAEALMVLLKQDKPLDDFIDETKAAYAKMFHKPFESDWGA